MALDRGGRGVSPKIAAFPKRNCSHPLPHTSRLNSFPEFFSREEPPLSAIRAIFWDVGGVLLTNAWDHTERTAALDHFHLDQEEFHDRHEMVVSSFERGKITLDEYLDRTVFYRTRPFSRDAFRVTCSLCRNRFPKYCSSRKR